MTGMLLLLGSAALAEEPSHPLELVADPAEHGLDVVVRNPTDEPVWLQITLPDYAAITTELRDATGQPMPPIPGPPMGMPLWTHRFERVEPGSTVRVGQLAIDDHTSRLRDNARTWDLTAHRGQTLSARFGFVLACDARTIAPSEVPPLPGAERVGPPDALAKVFCGALVSDVVALEVPR